MNPVTCLIVDDERLARQHLHRLAKTHIDIEVVGEACDPTDALRAIQQLQPQLLLLDIQMPNGSGFTLLHSLDQPPAVIFVTAHEKHAIRAFEVNAIDYLLKPVAPARFAHAVGRAVQRIRGIPAAVAPPPRPLDANDIALCEIGHSGHFVAVNRILTIEAEGNYTRITTADGKHRLARQTLKEWGSRLPPAFFVQLDRKIIINRKALRSVELTARSAHLTLGDKRVEIALGAAAATRLREILGS